MTELVDRVRHRLATADGDLDAAVRAEAGGIVDDAVLAGLRREVGCELTGAGPLEPLLALPGVTDVLVNAPDAVWIDRGSGLERAPVRFADDAAVRRLAQRLAAAPAGGWTTPALRRRRARRRHAAARGAAAAVRDAPRCRCGCSPAGGSTWPSSSPVARCPPAVADAAAPRSSPRGCAFVVTGGTGRRQDDAAGRAAGARCRRPSGSSSSRTPRSSSLDHPHVVRLVTRGANVEGAGAVGLRELVRQALRMRPDRLVVGEFRGAEMVELLVALNTGHEGGAATLHANSAADVPARLAALGGLAGLPARRVTTLAASALRVVVHLRRLRDGTRVVDEVGLLDRAGDSLGVHPVWRRATGAGRARRPAGRRTGRAPGRPAGVVARARLVSWVPWLWLAFALALLPGVPVTRARAEHLVARGRLGQATPVTDEPATAPLACGTDRAADRVAARRPGRGGCRAARRRVRALAGPGVGLAALIASGTGGRLAVAAHRRRRGERADRQLLAALRLAAAELEAGAAPA